MGVCFGERDDTTEAGWENEGGMALPEVTERFKKVDDDVWDKVVKRMRDKERREEKKRRENDK